LEGASTLRTTWIPALTLLLAFGLGSHSVDAAVIGQVAFERCLGGSQKTCIVDGDTIRFEGARIRLEDIDAPEVFSPKCASEKVLGQRATQRLVEWMNAGPFDVVYTAGATPMSTGESFGSSNGTDDRPAICSSPKAWPAVGTVHAAAGADSRALHAARVGK
jgi:hypothetical protein